MDEVPGGIHETHGRDGRAPFRALAVRGGALGDFILTLPSLQALRDAGYEVHLLTRSAYGRLAQAAGLVSGWRSLESPEAARLMMPRAEIGIEWRQWLAGFETVVSWMPDLDGAFRGQVLRCGAGSFRQGDWRCGGMVPAAHQLAEAVAFTGSYVHEIDNLFPADQMSGNGLVCQIAIHPGSGSLQKNWAMERWREVLVCLTERNPGISWLVITGEAEEERRQEIAAALDHAGLRWEPAHALDLVALSHRLRECRAFLGHDSGISHLAAACGVPCRLLFGPTDPAVWAPLGDHVKVLVSPAPGLDSLTSAWVTTWLRQTPW